MKRTILAMTLGLSAAALTACGTSTSDRAVSGGGLGALVGGGAGLMLGAPVEGALIGGAVGAGTGALTSPSQVELGRPAWK